MFVGRNDAQYSDDAYDYIVVGTGAAGSVVAERLSSVPGQRVLVLESGGSDRHVRHRLPVNYAATSHDPRYTVAYGTEPDERGVSEQWRTGNVVGGSTTINGMLWNRGSAAAYDAWEQAGNTGWNWRRFEEAFDVLECHRRGTHTRDHEQRHLGISIGRTGDPASEHVIAAMGAHGIPFVDDVNAGDDDRVGWAVRTISNGARVSNAQAFLRRAVQRPNLVLRTRSRVRRVLFEERTAVGVEVEEQGLLRTFAARREVIVCAGAMASPLLLERSGVGAPEVLDNAGVELVVDSCRVGENLRQHRGLLITSRLHGVRSDNERLSTVSARLLSFATYALTGGGVLAQGPSTLMATYRSRPSSRAPDTQAFFSPLSATGTDPTRPEVDREPGATFGFYPLSPTSAGSIHITGSDIDDPPVLVPRHLSTEHDREVTVAAFARARTILATAPFSDVATERSPGPDVESGPDVVRYAREHGFVGNHQSGTCALGPDADDVLDARLRVRGTRALRVVDASAMPTLPSGNSSAPATALGWIAAGLIAEDASRVPTR